MLNVKKVGWILPLAAVFTLAACGGGGSKDQADPMKAKLVDSGKLTFSTSGNYAPFSFADKDGKVTGYDVEVCEEIARRLGLKPDPKVVTFNQTIAGVEAGKYDMACTGVALTPARASSTSFYVTAATGVGGTSVDVLANSKYQKITDLKGARHGEASGASQGKDVIDAVGGDIKTTQYPGAAEQILALKAGRIDAMSVNALVAQYYAKQDPALRALPPINPGKQVQIVSRSNPALHEAVDKQIDAMWTDGTLKKLQEKYFGQAQERPAD